MDPRFLVIAFLVALALFAVGLWKYLIYRQEDVRASVVPKQFLTGNEREFFGRLSRALPEFHVFPQVSMGALLQPNVPPQHRLYWAVRETFAQKICDFVICSKDDLSPMLIVELDDRTHDFRKDATRDSTTARGALKTVRFWSRKKPSREEIRDLVQNALGPGAAFLA